MEINAKYKKSFEARLILASEETKGFYQEIKDSLVKYKKVKTRVSWTKETVSFGREKIAIINVKGKTLVIYLGLNPNDYAETKYSFVDVSDKAAYQEIPMMLKIKSKRGLKYALELLEVLMNNKNIELAKKPGESMDYVGYYATREIEELLAQGYMKKVVKKSVAVEDKEEAQMGKVTFNAKIVNPDLEVNDLFVVGNIALLGMWEPKKGIKMKKVDKNTYVASVKIPANTHMEFKIVREDSWYGVEKGIFTEEIPNHTYDIDGDLEVEDLIYSFRKDK